MTMSSLKYVKFFLMLKQRDKFVVRTTTTFENFVNSSF